MSQPAPSASAPGRRLPRQGVRAVAGAALLAGAWGALVPARGQQLDVRVGDALRLGSSATLDRAVTSTTDLGSLYAVLGCAAALAAAGRRRLAIDVLAVGVVTWNAAQASKTRVRRLRPYESGTVRRLVRPPTGSSFPSGHAAVGTAVGSVLGDAALATGGGRAAAGVLRALGPYVAVSRVYAGVHHPTDVLGGVGMGLLAGAAWQGPPGRALRCGLRASARLRGRAPAAGP